MFVLTIADDGADPDVTAPLLVARADGPLIRRVLGLVLADLEGSPASRRRRRIRPPTVTLRPVPDP
jgi:hypothetical protein